MNEEPQAFDALTSARPGVRRLQFLQNRDFEYCDTNNGPTSRIQTLRSRSRFLQYFFHHVSQRLL